MIKAVQRKKMRGKIIVALPKIRKMKVLPKMRRMRKKRNKTGERKRVCV